MPQNKPKLKKRRKLSILSSIHHQNWSNVKVKEDDSDDCKDLGITPSLSGVPGNDLRMDNTRHFTMIVKNSPHNEIWLSPENFYSIRVFSLPILRTWFSPMKLYLSVQKNRSWNMDVIYYLRTCDLEISNI